MSGYMHLYSNCNNNVEVSLRGKNRNQYSPTADLFLSSFEGRVDANADISDKCVIGVFDEALNRSVAESLQLESKNEGTAENLSSSETELSDTESTHQAMSLSSPEDGPHLGSEEDCDTLDPKNMMQFKVVSPYYVEQRSRPFVGSSPESVTEKGDSDRVEVEKEDEEKCRDMEREVKVEKDALEQEEADSEYVMSCNLRGPSRHNVKKAERLILGLMSTPKLARTPEESDEQYTKRVRKHNFLSLAQEFVARNKSQAGGEANAENKTVLTASNPSLPQDYQSEDAREWAKNVKNIAKCPEVAAALPRAKLRRPINLESLSLNESSSSPLFLPVNSVLGSSSTNQNAIHRYHQRSLAQLESRPSKKGRGLHGPSDLAPTSPTHAGPQCKNARAVEPANRARMSYPDLPANVAKMAQEGGAKLNYERAWRHHRSTNENPPANAGKWNRVAIDGQLSRSDCDLPSYRRNSKVPSPPHEILGGFDVYNIETAMPTIDWIAMEEHLAKAAKEEMFLHKHHRNNREEIRRKLAMGSDTDDYYGGERMNRKPSLQARLQSGMNLQICFMNETASDPDSVQADQESLKARGECGIGTPVIEKNIDCVSSPLSGSISTPENLSSSTSAPQLFPLEESKDFLTKQARLQAEARLALAQAKQMAHMQMEVEKQRKKKSPIAEMVGIPFPDGRHKVSRHALVEMNLAQLQVIVNDLHTQIENLNEELVHLLMERDDLHMEQDSMLVDIEDLTRYL